MIKGRKYLPQEKHIKVLYVIECKWSQVKGNKILFSVVFTWSFFQVSFYLGISPSVPNGLNLLGILRATQLNILLKI